MASNHIVAAIREFGAHQREILSFSISIISTETSKLCLRAEQTPSSPGILRYEIIGWLPDPDPKMTGLPVRFLV